MRPLRARPRQRAAGPGRRASNPQRAVSGALGRARREVLPQRRFQPFHHPLVDDLNLNYDALEIPADTGQTIVAYTAEPDSPSQQALDLLASWTSSPDQAPAGTAEYDS